jgi:hypothetical protein
MIVFFSYSFVISDFGCNYLKDLSIANLFLKNNFTMLSPATKNFVLAIEPQSSFDDSLPSVNNSNTFSANGVFSSVLFPNYDILFHNANNTATSFEKDNNSRNGNIINTSLYEFPKVISGTWILNVTQGSVTNFHGFFKLITSDGLEKHSVEMDNFKNQNISIILNPYASTIINGYVDFKIDDKLFESNLPIKIQLNRINTITVYIYKHTVSDLLFDNPIYGVINSFENFRNEELLVLDNQ